MTDPVNQLVKLLERERKTSRRRDLFNTSLILLAIFFVTWITLGTGQRADDLVEAEIEDERHDCVENVFDAQEAYFEEELTTFLAVLLADDIDVPDAEQLPPPKEALQRLREAGRAPSLEEIEQACER